jgi:hypothetical protein
MFCFFEDQRPLEVEVKKAKLREKKGQRIFCPCSTLSKSLLQRTLNTKVGQL